MLNENFVKEIGLMKSYMSPSDVTLYASLIVTGADGHDLDILLTSIFLSGKNEGIEIAKETIKEAAKNAKIDLG